MSDSPIERLARCFRLRDFDDFDDAPFIIDFCVRLVAWWHHQADKSLPQFDHLISDRGDQPLRQVNFLLHLSTIDRLYFDLAKRMAAATLRRHNPPDRAYLLIAAQLLTDEPPSNATKTARDVPMVIANALTAYLGKKPTGKEENSGCGLIRKKLRAEHGVHCSYTTIVDVWKNNDKKLTNARIPQAEALEFLRSLSPTK